MLKKVLLFLFLICTSSLAETLRIATVHNHDMNIMKELSDDFIQKNPTIKLEWITFDENALRKRITNDIEVLNSQYDIITIGLYEVAIWAQQGKLLPLNDLPNNYDYNDLLPTIRQSLTINKKLYAAPFYAESLMVMYRTDLFKEAGLTMPKEPSWAFINKAAGLITNKNKNIYGICLRGKAGWGENIALLTSMANSFGAKWFNEQWEPQLTSPAWQKTLSYYVSILRKYGPPDAVNNGFNENLALFKAGKCGIWVDATVAAAAVSNDESSVIADHVGFALAPHNNLGKRASWLWAWSLAIPKNTQNSQAAKKFIAWATSKNYLNLVAKEKGLSNVPPGTRKSLYDNKDYIRLSPFAQITLESINNADLSNPAFTTAPYIGIQYITIPEFQTIGTTVGRQLCVVLAGHMSINEGLTRAQNTTQALLSDQRKKELIKNK